MSGRKERSGLRPQIPGPAAATLRAEAVRRALPKDGSEISGTQLVANLRREAGSKATAIRWLNQAKRRRVVTCRVDGRRRWYSISFSGFMNAGQAEWFLRGGPISFLRESASLAPEYSGSLAGMTLFWEQASATLVLSLARVIAAAQSISTAHDGKRPGPTVAVARQQADVLTEVFVKPWVQDLIAALHQFLEVERRKNAGKIRLGAPSALEGFRNGWEWADGPEGMAHKLWISRMNGPESGPWGAFLDRARRAEEERMRLLSQEAAAAGEAQVSVG